MSYQWKFFRAGGFDQVKLDNIVLPNINSVPALGTNAPGYAAALSNTNAAAPVSTNASAAK